MKAKSSAILVVLASVCGTAIGHASTSTSEATAHVLVRVTPSITVSSPRMVIIDLKDRQTDSPIRSQVQFQVRANTQEVELQVACTDLCKAGDPSSPYKIPVAGAGVQIIYEHAGGTAGGDRLLPWQPVSSVGLLPAGWTGAATEIGVFRTATATFSQNVTVDVSWHAPAANLPTGEYRGFVRLIGMVQP
jgi:hypothetical protein